MCHLWLLLLLCFVYIDFILLKWCILYYVRQIQIGKVIFIILWCIYIHVPFYSSNHVFNYISVSTTSLLSPLQLPLFLSVSVISAKCTQLEDVGLSRNFSRCCSCAQSSMHPWGFRSGRGPRGWLNCITTKSEKWAIHLKCIPSLKKRICSSFCLSHISD